MNGEFCNCDLCVMNYCKCMLRNIFEQRILQDKKVLLRGRRISIDCTRVFYTHGGKTAITSAARTTRSKFDGICWDIYAAHWKCALEFWAADIMQLKISFLKFPVPHQSMGTPSHLHDHVTSHLDGFKVSTVVQTNWMWTQQECRLELTEGCETVPAQMYSTVCQDCENSKDYDIDGTTLHDILEKFRAGAMLQPSDICGTWPEAVGPLYNTSYLNIRLNEVLR